MPLIKSNRPGKSARRASIPLQLGKSTLQNCTLTYRIEIIIFFHQSPGTNSPGASWSPSYPQSPSYGLHQNSKQIFKGRQSRSPMRHHYSTSPQSSMFGRQSVSSILCGWQPLYEWKPFNVLVSTSCVTCILPITKCMKEQCLPPFGRIPNPANIMHKATTFLARITINSQIETE